MRRVQEQLGSDKSRRTRVGLQLYCAAWNWACEQCAGRSNASMYLLFKQAVVYGGPGKSERERVKEDRE